jgi:hypothetical protein
VSAINLSIIRRWLAVAAVSSSLVVPAVAVGASNELPRGIMGPNNEDPSSALAERTQTELQQRAQAPSVTAGDSGFSWSDAGIGAGVTAAAVALLGAGLGIRRRAHTRAQPAV